MKFLSCGKYDRQGRPMSREAWAEALETEGQQRVAETTLPDGTWISTVWLGLDTFPLEIGPPRIFETMVFPSRDTLDELDVARYATEEDAVAGHAAMVAKWQGGGRAEGAGP